MSETSVGIRSDLFSDEQFLHLSPEARWTYCVLGIYLTQARQAKKKIKKAELLAMSGLEEQTLVKKLQELEAEGFVEKTSGGIALPSVYRHFQVISSARVAETPEAADVGFKSRIQEVFSYWSKAMELPRPRLTELRKRRIIDALKRGWTVDDLCRAIDGCKLSPFHMGDNERHTPYNDLELILRDSRDKGDNVERFVGIYNVNSKLSTPASEEYKQTTSKGTEEANKRLNLIHRARRRNDAEDLDFEG